MSSTASRSELARDSAPGSAPSGYLSPGVLFALLAGYFVLQVIIRTWLSSSADLDEADQLVLAQKLSWGYGSQPPLYTWVQRGFFAVFGQSILALSLFKNLLLLGTYLLTYASTRFITRSSTCGAAAAISLLLIPQVAWESQRDLTHSVLSATLAAATLLTFLRAHASRKLAWYAAFGLCAGLGLLSKYNYVFWLLGLMLGAVSLKEFRPAVFHWRMGLAVLLAVLIFLPNGLWILTHRDLALFTASKLEVGERGAWLAVVGTGLRRLVVAVASFVGPLTLVYWLLLGRAPKQDWPQRPGAEYERLLWRTLLVIGFLLAVLVLLFRATGLRERWLQPVLICAPVLAASWCRERLDSVRQKRLAAIGLVVMSAVAIVMPGRILLAERMKREEPLNHPYDELSAQIRNAWPDSALMVADTHLLAGNLRMAFPERTIVSPELVELFRNGEEHCLLIWDATSREAPPKNLVGWANRVAPGALDRAQPQFFSATYKYHHARQRRWALVRLY